MRGGHILRAVARAALRSVWAVRYARWRSGSTGTSREGYSVIVPVPGDLPIFLQASLQACKSQTAPHCNEILVVPDAWNPGLTSIFSDAIDGLTVPARLVKLPWFERHLLPLLRDPGRNHGTQIVAGVQQASSEFVLLHDADLFPVTADLHETSYAFAKAGGYAVVGVDPAWDPAYAERGRQLVATWEMVARRSWLHSFAPRKIMRRDATLTGKSHTFDTTFWAQWNTRDALVGRVAAPPFVHFNHLISAYRYYQHSAKPFSDSGGRLMLLRGLALLFSGDASGSRLPDVAEILEGLRQGSREVVYPSLNAAQLIRDLDDLVQVADRAPAGESNRRALHAYVVACRDAIHSRTQALKPSPAEVF